jgi:hypothetical protein
MSHDEAIWTSFEKHKELTLASGKTKNLWKNSVNLKFSGTKDSTTVLFIAPLAYQSFDKKINKVGEKKTKNICIQERFSLATLDTNTPSPEWVSETTPASPMSETSEVPALDAASPAPATVTSEAPKIAADPAAQTTPATGPALWITLLIAGMLSSADTAWCKSQYTK